MKGFSVMVHMSTAMAGVSYGVMSTTPKPLTNAQTVRGRPTFLYMSVQISNVFMMKCTVYFFSSTLTVFMVFL